MTKQTRSGHKNSRANEARRAVAEAARYGNDSRPAGDQGFVVTVFRMDIKKAPSLTAFYKRMSINIITRD